MIRNEIEYKAAVERLMAEEKSIAIQQAELKEMGLTVDQIKRAIDPIMSFHLQLADEVETYERLKRGDIQEIQNLRGLGHALICIRIAIGLTQRELAERLGVNESQVSRDERNEYHGITLERAAKVLEALGAEIKIGVTLAETTAT